MKNCACCKTMKEFEAFPLNPKMKTGRDSYCRACKAAKTAERRRAIVAKRRAVKLRATPAWANEEKMQEFYFAADFLGMVTGEWYEVDHIVPLQGRSVCGLHCESNLRVITRFENRSKGAR